MRAAATAHSGGGDLGIARGQTERVAALPMVGPWGAAGGHGLLGGLWLVAVEVLEDVVCAAGDLARHGQFRLGAAAAAGDGVVQVALGAALAAAVLGGLH